MLIGGAWRAGRNTSPVIDPYRGTELARAPESTTQDLDDALDAAFAAKRAAASTPAYERAAILRRAASLLSHRAPELAQLMARETGKAVKDAQMEVSRSVQTLELSAEEATRIEGEHVPLDSTAMGHGKLAMTLRFPVGVVAGITPFNAPLNLACHKVGPALAAGNCMVLKAPPQSPCVVAELARVLVESGATPGSLNVLFGGEVGPALVKDPRVDFVSFTGSSRVGEQIKATCGLKRVALELGGTGSTIVHEDALVAEAAMACARNSMRLAGQSCISVQNVFAHERVYDSFVRRLVEEVLALKVGDPLDSATDVGTLIDEQAAVRVQQWVGEAVAAGAKMLSGGQRQRAQYQPAVLVEVCDEMKVVKDEIFGPVVTVQRYRDLEGVFDKVSAARYGLQCGIFTRSMEIALAAARSLRVGGVIINGTSTWRTDQMPYGGVRASGIGREGPRYSIREMTEERLVVFNL
jgi:acyl-CoA reductase-like NAD-dependent aldehyde dehydrogenase